MIGIKQWHIWDFPDNLYILLDKETKEEFFNLMFKVFRGKRPYARFLGVKQMGLKQYCRGIVRKMERSIFNIFL